MILRVLNQRSGWLVVLASVLLQGCAVVTAPGFDYADPKLRTSVTLGQYVPGDVNAQPQGVVIPITPALVQSEVRARPREISPEVRQLFGTSKPYTIGTSDIISIVVYDHPELLPNAGAVISQQADPTGISSAPGFIV
jgi:polysaccharide export outer membrane protein